MAPRRKSGGPLLLLLAAALAAAALALTPAAAAGARLPTPATDTASAAWSRLQGLVHGEGLLRTEDGSAAAADASEEDVGRGKRHRHRAIIAIKYEVPPSLQHDFVDEWRKLEDSTSDEKGNLVFDLKKTWGDNLYFWAYGEWKSYEDYMDHFRSDSAEGFLSWLDDHDVMWTLFPLKNITDEGAAKSSKADPASVSNKGGGDKGGGDDPRDAAAHVVIQYHVQPSHVDEFLGAWQDAAESTWDEEANTIYALRKVANMNHHFLAYGTWKDYDAYMDHFTSKHVRKLRQFLAERDIQWFAEPLMKKGSQAEDV